MTARRAAGLLALVLLALGGAAACGSPRRSEPLAGPLPLDRPALRRGEKVYAWHCSPCHPGGEGGLGPALNNKPLPATAIRLQVREGVGQMPAFPEEVVSDDDLGALVQYMEALREHGAE